MNTALAIFIGGGAGSLARYGISVLAKTHLKSAFPWGTLIANILACLVLGVMVYFLSEKLDSQPFLKPLLVIGFCGGFSTFSTFSYETLELFRSEHFGIAIANILISVAVCVALLWVVAKAGK